MNILMISTPICPPWDNAVKNMILDFAIDTNKTVHVMSTQNNKLKRENIVFEEVYSEGEINLSLSLSQKLEALTRLMKSDPDIDIYHFFFVPRFITSSITKIILKFKKKKVIQTIFNKVEPQFNFKRLLFGDVITVCSNYMERLLVNNGVSNVIKIHPGVDLQKFSPLNVKENHCSELRAMYNLNNNPVIFYAGRYDETKGIDDLEEIIPLVLEKIPDLKVIMACRMENNRKHIKRKMQFESKMNELNIFDSIVSLGTVENIRELIYCSDITIYPMTDTIDKIDIPVILLESLAMQKPIIISDIEPLNEVMKNDVGVKIKKGDRKGFANAIVELIEDKEKRIAMGGIGRIMVETYFNIKDVSMQYNSLYNELYRGK